MTTETISSDAAEGADLLATAQQALEDLKAVDPVVLDVREAHSQHAASERGDARASVGARTTADTMGINAAHARGSCRLRTWQQSTCSPRAARVRART